MLKWIAVNYTVMLNGYSQWLNIKGEKQFYRDIVVLISVMLAFNHKKDAIKEIIKIYCMLFLHCTFEDWTWNYCNIKVYLKTLMLDGINRD